MIHLFRQIRRRFLNQGKLGKYVSYAVGEIFLVVVGILIALSINSWNGQRQNEHKENSYLQKLEIDLEQQLSYIDIQLDYEHKYANLAQPLLESVEADQSLRLDSAACMSLKKLTERKTFIKINPTYQDLISTGNIDLLSNEELRNALLIYYSELERFEKIIQNNNTLHTDELFSQKIMELVYIGETLTPKYIELANQLLQDPTKEMILLNLIDFRYVLAHHHINFMNELKELTHDMLTRLQEVNQ
jgi:hypothetical protein